MICDFCKTEVAEGQIRCPKCGKKMPLSAEMQKAMQERQKVIQERKKQQQKQDAQAYASHSRLLSRAISLGFAIAGLVLSIKVKQKITLHWINFGKLEGEGKAAQVISTIAKIVSIVYMAILAACFVSIPIYVMIINN